MQFGWQVKDGIPIPSPIPTIGPPAPPDLIDVRGAKQRERLVVLWSAVVIRTNYPAQPTAFVEVQKDAITHS